MVFNSVIRRNILSKSKRLYILPSVNYSSDSSVNEPRRIDTRVEALKRGTGHRSSFNGTVCTVFGATGFLGWALCANLGRHGSQLIIPYRADPYVAQDLKICGDLGQVLFSPFEIDDDESIRKAVKYSNCVINLVGKDYDSKNWPMENINIDGARRIARICREMGVKKLIHVSALNADPNPEFTKKGDKIMFKYHPPIQVVAKRLVYGESNNSFLAHYENSLLENIIGTSPIFLPTGSRFYRTKWHGEVAVREEFPNAVIVRPSDIFGENDKFLYYYGNWPRLVFRSLYLHNKGEGIFKRPVYLDDVTEGIYEIVRRHNDDVQGKTYQFFGPRAYELSDLCDYIYGCMWKDKDWGFKREDSRFSLLFHLHLEYQSWFRVYPRQGIFKERFERENQTDVVHNDLPSLKDLGTRRTPLPDVISHFVIYHRAYTDYADEPNEWVFPPEPKVVEYA